MLRFPLAVITLAITMATAAAGLVIVLPPIGGHAGWMVRVAVTEFSLFLLLPALMGLFLAWFSGWARMRRTGLVSAIFAGIAIPLALVPAIRGELEARSYGVPIDPLEYVSGSVTDVADQPDETLEYTKAHGTGLDVDVWSPTSGAGKTTPAMIYVHGTSWSEGHRGEFGRWNTWFGDQGYVAFDIDRRTAGDVKCAVSWIRDNAHRFDVDPSRILLMGEGSGGHLALLAAYTDEDEIPSTCPEVTPSSNVDAVVAFYAPAEQPERAEEPFRHLDADDPPTLLAHGTHDSVVPVTDSRRMAAELDAVGVPNRLAEIDYADHVFDLNWGGFGAQIARTEIVRFLDPGL